jgi:hypothetical protein
MKPPRALWVPFELGRPFGAPNNPEFQMDVLKSLLALFSRERGPVLEDYPYDAPAIEDDDVPWSCPLPLTPLQPADTAAGQRKQALLAEVGMLAPWHAESVRRRGRSTFKLSGLQPDRAPEIAEFLAAIAAGEDAEPPAGIVDPMPAALRSLAEDLKAYYMEAAAEQPGAPPTGGVRMGTWFYHETCLGQALYDIRDRFVAEAQQRAASGASASTPATPALIPARFRQRPDTGGS